MNPPLRTMADVEAVRAGLADGTIDAIATDHAPHAPETKEQPLDQAPPGMLGLETALGVALAHLDMPLADVVAALSWKPAAIAGVGRPSTAARSHPGEPANLTVFDPDERVGGRAGASSPARAATPRTSACHCAAGSSHTILDGGLDRRRRKGDHGDDRDEYPSRVDVR